jgi:chemotaxis protein methyltransferase CheR
MNKEFKFTDKDFKFVVSKVYEQSGIRLADHKRDMVYGRLARRLRELNLKSFEDYCDLIESSQGEVEIGNFVNAVTTNLTSFFRESHHFDHLKECLQKISLQPNSNKRIRLWSAASSSGPEPYSMAMTVCEGLKNYKSYDVKILATDIDTNMLNTSIAGEYEERLLEKIPSGYKNKYVVKNSRKDNKGVMAQCLKDLITFKQLNLMHNWPMKGPFDFVFCRNVVIYFDKPTQIELFRKISSLMKVGGILYIGHSENLFKVSEDFELIGRTIYKKVK